MFKTICMGFLVVILKFLIFGYTDTFYYEDGQKKEEHSFTINGDLTDLAYWHENGQKKEESKWKDNLADGPSIQWYSSGLKKEAGVYKLGCPFSLEVWKPNGEKCAETNIKNGSGTKIEYYENGDKRYTQNWTEGKRTGEWIEWRRKGNDEYIIIRQTF